jgi:IS5 family transposase
MAQLTLTSYLDVRNQIFAMPDTELRDIVIEGWGLVDKVPAILECIQEDLDRAALAGKQERIAERVDRASHCPLLPAMPAVAVDEVRAYPSQHLTLGTGRPRLLDAEAVFILAMCRAHLDSVTSRQALDRIHDSMTLRSYFEARGIPLPSRTTMHTWINCLSASTYEFIYNAQMVSILEDGLDSFDSVTADSFSVWADTAWPTDSAMIYGLLNRAWRRAAKLFEAGMPSFTRGWVSLWLERIHDLDREIAFACGKPGSRRKIRRLYKKLYEFAEKTLVRLDGQFEQLLPAWHEQLGSLPFKTKKRTEECIDSIFADLASAARVVAYSRDRMIEDRKTPMSDKVLSLSDTDAAYIRKGGREAVIGYKPQIMRSRNGFVTAFELQKGNPADSARLVPLTEQHIERCGTIPHTVSVDDGYSSAGNREKLRELGVQIISMNGATGRKVTPEQEWESEEYRQARDNRSAVESQVFTLRYKFHLYTFSRRTLGDVQAELYEKIIAHNLWRAALLRKRAAANERLTDAQTC